MVKCIGNADNIAMALSCFTSYCQGAIGPRYFVAATFIDGTTSASTATVATQDIVNTLTTLTPVSTRVPSRPLQAMLPLEASLRLSNLTPLKPTTTDVTSSTPSTTSSPDTDTLESSHKQAIWIAVGSVLGSALLSIPVL
ncbi:hypothetical protein L207DRAFT_592923 [Hyaloscypha variabilis F]|uniref:Uncharacterized protein n=1 Tax=Hyaloscypha variabilis (strain UAMH 11265 / GT02V1 / F) TaxID=1149755 RepID=A0A2J6QUE0_HYAVF|nr:hypothetical protein L207DRAFT_592923 [Hyaloscypha variabilis F]